MITTIGPAVVAITLVFKFSKYHIKDLLYSYTRLRTTYKNTYKHLIHVINYNTNYNVRDYIHR